MFKKTGVADELCYLMFCQNEQKNEVLSPTTDPLLHHLKQSNYQAFVWSCALEAMQDLESREGHGWMKEKELLVPLPITKAPVPVSLLPMTCKCKTSACQQNCSCHDKGLACTKGCFCMTDNEACRNPHDMTSISDSEERDE